MKIIYAGTPEFAVPPLQALASSGHEIVAVYTQPDRPSGRGRKLLPGPVKVCAEKNNLPVFQPESLREVEAIQELKALSADLMVVAAYGLILPVEVLQAPRLGCVNIHASLLPRWRGAAPIQRSILAGDNETGITLMQMDVGLDTGGMLAKKTVAITDDSTAAQLHDELSILGADVLMQNLAALEQQSLKAEIQNEELATYADKLLKQEAAIDWNLPAQTLQRQIRAYNPWPVSFTSFSGQNVKIWSAVVTKSSTYESPGKIMQHNRQGVEVCCGKDLLTIKEIQFAGKKRQTADQILNARNLSGAYFGK